MLQLYYVQYASGGNKLYHEMMVRFGGDLKINCFVSGENLCTRIYIVLYRCICEGRKGNTVTIFIKIGQQISLFPILFLTYKLLIFVFIF